jgi:hypothetical protein
MLRYCFWRPGQRVRPSFFFLSAHGGVANFSRDELV